MKFKIYTLAISVIAILSTTKLSAQALPGVEWAQALGGTGSETGTSIATDIEGNVYITGAYSASITLGTTTLTSNGGNDIFIAKVKSTGEVLWAKSFGGTATGDDGRAVAIDPTGKLYLTGTYRGTVSFGTTTLTAAGTSTTDIFVSRLNPVNGDVIWVQGFGGTTNANETVNGIAIDNNDNVYITGIFGSPTVAFGSITLNNASTSNDIFVTKINSSGNIMWAKGYGSAANENANAISSDASGNTYITGIFNGPDVTFGTTTLTGISSNNDVFITKIDTAGNVVWAKAIGGTGSDNGYGITADASGNVYATGGFSDNLTVGSTTLTSLGGADIYVVKYDVTGNPVWAKSYGGTGAEGGYKIALDSNGYIYNSGFYTGTIAFGATNLTSAGSNDVYLLKMNSSGNPVSAVSFGGTAMDVQPVQGNGIAINSDNIYVTGYFNAGAMFGNTTLTSLGSSDVFLVKLGTANLGVSSSQLIQSAIYPNPVTDSLFLKTNLLIDNVTILNTVGQQVIKHAVIKNEKLDVSHLPKGVYIVSIKYKNGQVSNHKIIKE
ncbi:Beta-propeller repeat protein [Chryseobacterium sp. MOF25P]|uniref:SBBP repeat-containing protein n=1 Tax=unclassified Chryseobacterium TaxID=2593645 RepID=UPI0008058BC6|nr:MULTISPECIES: SBBP repeat-containing protein [unclassified Chryseobacterium]OBW43351.1 Beta-propeller repeat protein [Chryseobacterium sp. MOF25P]OBW46991.1 Beta-propeller repeat protein [Chryseobacterium sp. BGARF1]